MPRPPQPVIVFHGRNELEAQAARDVLSAAMIPVLHLPSLSTGIFGVPQTTRVAVPSDYAEQAVAALQDAGLAGKAEARPTGLAAFQETMEDRFPLGVSPLPGGSRLVRVLVGLAVVIIALVVLVVVTRSSSPP